MKNPHEKIAREWVEKAESDLGFARASFNDFDNFYGQMCVLCHDAVEKYLKAFLIFHGIKPERTHDLVALLGQCVKFSVNLENFREDCITLNRYYTPLKYPSHYPTPTREQTKKAIDSAVRFSRVVCEEIGYKK